MEPGESAEDRPAAGALSAAQRRAEIRRRKLLQNSEVRMQRIVGQNQEVRMQRIVGQATDPEPDVSVRSSEPRFHLDLDGSQSWTPPLSRPSPIHTSPSPSDTSPSHQPDCSKPLEGAVEQDPSEDYRGPTETRTIVVLLRPGLSREGLGVKREGLGVKRKGLGVKREGLGVKREGLGVEREGLGVKRARCEESYSV
uniref:Uncharacterized protein n=1 Tax=Knipowitschia caucasica TaxID=637954 RepID=A0AAV2JC67_KNICA